MSVRRRPFPELRPGASLKRAPALVPLSQDHHHALVQSLRLRDAAAGEPSGAPAVARAFLEHWRSAMRGHFADEEVVLFPRAEPLDPESHDHVRFEERVVFAAVQSRLGPEELEEIGSALAAHRAARGLAPGCPSPTG